MIPASAPPTLALGSSNFRRMREQGQPYVDKTVFLADVIVKCREAAVFCRPRRFGKSLQLSTLRSFLEQGPDDLSPLFTDLAIWSVPEARAHFQRHPVVHLSLKDVKGESWEEAEIQLADAIRWECDRLLALQPGLVEVGGKTFELLRGGQNGAARLSGALRDLTQWLHRLTGERAVILLDEYDGPIHVARDHGYYPRMIGFLRSFLGAGFKDNTSLFLGVVTGVLRVSREGLFSSFNNAAIFSVLDRRYADAFGFTEAEVAGLREQVGSPLSMEDLRHWYNGYRFGDTVIYNPWSVICALDRQELRAWWVDTGSHAALGRLVLHGGEPVQRDLRRWMAGESVRGFISDTVLLEEERPDDVIAMLVHGGYLTPTAIEARGGGWMAEMVVPNQDVAASLVAASQRWLSAMHFGPTAVDELCTALLSGDTRFGPLLARLIEGATSAHDFPFPDAERVYHAFLLGLLSVLHPRFLVWSNVESGLGRADILIIPRAPGLPGAVIELKEVASLDDTEAAMTAALAQIELLRYDRKLQDIGAAPIQAWAVVFCGKQVSVRLAAPPVALS